MNLFLSIRLQRCVNSVAFALFLVAALGAGAAKAVEFLDPTVAFRVTPSLKSPDAVALHFAIEPGYYLYREKLHLEAEGASLGELNWPAGKVKFDTTFQKDVETYRTSFDVIVPVKAAQTGFLLRVGMQGCADAGLCYPPMRTEFRVTLPGAAGPGFVQRVDGEAEASSAAPPISGPPGKSPGLVAGLLGGESKSNDAAAESSGVAVAPPSLRSGLPSNAGTAESLLQGGSWWATVGAFWVMGLLLSFTPCVLPMLPILSSVIAGGGAVSRQRGFLLAVAYSLGMALVYTVMGVAAGLAGEGIAAALQKPWVLAAFATMLAALSLSMFDVYELRLPAALSTQLDGASRRLPGGRMLGVFTMGALSALIVSPCVTAPLAGTLVFLGKTRDVTLAGSALFAMALGMSVPLLLLGASAGSWLPRSGAWMVAVKRFFGLVLLAVALWILQPVLQPALVLAAWSALLLFTGLTLRPFDAHPHAGTPRVALQRAAGAACLLWAVLLGIGAAAGGDNPLRPLAPLSGGRAAERGAEEPRLAFKRVPSVTALEAALHANHGRPVMLDFYADWCTSCKEMERETFSDPKVRARLANVVLLQADVTANTDDDKALLKRFGLFGPPGTLFFGTASAEVSQARVVGFQTADEFLGTLAAAGI